MRKNSILLTAATAFVLLGTAACTPTKHVRGNLLLEEQLDTLKVGIDSPSTVLHKLGSPTAKAPFDDNKWYYIGQKTEKHGILDEDIVDEKIIAITFNEEGKVSSVEETDNNRIDTPFVRRKTPTSGNEMTALQQFMGNLGRFNKGMND